MRLVQTNRAPDGVRLGVDVFDGRTSGAPLLRAGVRLDERFRRAITSAGISRIVVDDEETEGIDIVSPLSGALRSEATERLTSLLARAHAGMRRGDGVSYAGITAAEQVAGLIADEVLGSAPGPVTMLDAAGPRGHAVQHLIDSTVLGLLIGRRLFAERGRIVAGGARSTGGIDDALRRLALGSLLHDIGLADPFEDVRVVDGALVEVPAKEARHHVEGGYEALPHVVVSAHAAAIVRYHHERWLGHGPGRLAGEGIPQFARIAAVADVFDTVTSDRPGIGAVAPHVAVAAIVRGAGTLFDPEVVDLFRWIAAPYPVGTEVTLSDGSSGVVAAVPATSPHQPRVRVLRDPRGAHMQAVEVSLHAEHGLAIAAAA